MSVELWAPIDRQWTRPVRIVVGDGTAGARFGGRAPVLAVAQLADGAEFFCTIPLDVNGQSYLSVFLNGSFQERLRFMNRGVVDDAQVLIVHHARTPKRDDDRWASSFAERGLAIDDAVRDVADDGVSPREGHKIGGRAFCIQEPELEGEAAAVALGAVLVLQMDFPRRGEDVSGDWPFADGMFQVFAAPPFTRASWSFQK